jgi:hypothetical protein
MTHAMKTAHVRARMLIACTFLFLCATAQGQSLIYSLSYSETRASFHARYPNGALGASVNEKLAMLRQNRKTEIYSVSMPDRKRSLLFSDEGMNLEISPVSSVASIGKLYVTGVFREWRTGQSPGAYEDARALYEIGLDGSKQFRRLLDSPPNQGPVLLSPQGTKALIEAFVDGKYVIWVYGIPGWNQLYKWEVGKLTKAHCPDCLPLSFGWLADNTRLFFNLELGDDDSIDESNHNVPGIYLTSEDGTDLGSISPEETGHFELSGYIHPNSVDRLLIAQLPDGRYVFQDYAARQGHPGQLEPFLVISGAESKTQKQFPLKAPAGSWSLSPSGKYVAYIEEHQLQNYQSERQLWVKDLDSGEEKELLVVPPPNPPASPEPNLTLTVLGWVETPR